MAENDPGRFLLEAALQDDFGAIKSFEKWRRLVEFDEIRSDSYCVLPAVYKNLVSLGADDSALTRLKGITRRTWLENQVRIPILEDLFKHLNKNAVEYLILVDFFEILGSLGDEGIFPLDGFEILVKPENAATAISLFGELGWKEVQSPAFGLDFSVFKEENRLAVTVFRANGKFEQKAWIRPRDIESADIKVKGLTAPMHILYLCMQNRGKRPNSVRQSFLTHIILNANAEFDWSELVEAANSCGLSRDVLKSLDYCAETCGIKLPANVRSNLARNAYSEPATRVRNMFSGYRELWKNHLIEVPFEKTHTTAGEFARFLCKQWGVSSTVALPWEIAKRVVRSLS